MAKLKGKKLKYRGSGKGDKRRPMSISTEQYGKNYEKAFSKRKQGIKNGQAKTTA